MSNPSLSSAQFVLLAAGLSDADRAVLAAYARGVNAYLETYANNLPLDFSLLRYDPRP